MKVKGGHLDWLMYLKGSASRIAPRLASLSCRAQVLRTSRVAHPLGNRCPEYGSPTYTRTVDRIRTRVLGDPSDPKTRMVPLYHGGPL
ncbi:hypothetical protein E2C01_016885 [Portunus trituberculatus]|uniref:Uncharacterized protein n=1 Tax=Portunus trituberculatus TaxID=210409 RepID=A0A5B7DQU3_PORTR|nr:hypothetical protein [Portunus trituberculatus]